MTLLDQTPDPQPQSPVRNRRRMILRSLAWTFAGIGALLVLLLAGVSWYTTTADFQRRAAGQVISLLEDATGGRVEIGALKFNLWHLAAEVDGLVIHGLEGPGEAPYISVDRLLVRITIFSLFQKTTGTGVASHVGLSLLRVEHPQVHLIVNKDGSTNQPVPKKKSTSTEPIQDTLLDLKAGKAEIVNGVALYNNHAVPFDAAARDLGVNVHYISSSDRYGISLGLNDLRTKMMEQPEAKSRLTLEAELGRNMAALRKLEFETGERSKLTADAELNNFANPTWQVSLAGDLEIKQISVLSGFPGLTAGTVSLDIKGHSCNVSPVEAQKQPRFWQRRHPDKSKSNTKALPPDPDCLKGYLMVGSVKARGAGYVDEYVRVHDVNLDSMAHITPTELLLNALVIDLPQDGRIAGDFRINNWLGAVPADTPEKSPTIAASQKTVNTTAKAIDARPPVAGDRKLPQVAQAHGYVNVTLSKVSLRAIEEITQPRGFSDLGLDVAVTGPAKAEWGGDFSHIEDSVNVSANLKLAPTGVQRKGRQNIPVSGAVVAEYRGQGQVINIQQLLARTPETTLEASGVLGVNRGEAATSLQVNAEMGDLSELDSVLTAIGYDPQQKRGASALPVDLKGSARFHGTASGRLAALDIKGHLEADNVDAMLNPETHILVDALVADAEYTPQGLAVASSTIKRGASILHAEGALKAHPVMKGRTTDYEWDKESQVDARVQLAEASAVEVLQMAGQSSLPITGTLNADAHLTGSLGRLNGSGIVALRDGVAYGEPFQLVQTNLNVKDNRIQAQDIQIRAHSVQVLSGNAAYDLTSKQVEAHVQTRDLKLSGFQNVKSRNLPVDGVLTGVVDANGTLEEPNLKANLTLKDVTLEGSPVGQLIADVHSQGSTVYLQARSNLLSTDLTADAQADLTGDYDAQGKVEFSNLNAANVLRMLNNTSLKATSNLAGTINFNGPLKTPRALRGTAEVRNIDVTVAGLQLKADPIHASLENGTVVLQPAHITGPETDVHIEGSAQILGVTDPKGGRIQAKASGGSNLAILHTLRPNVIASGRVDFTVTANGTVTSPGLAGKVEMKGANLALEEIPNGLSNMNGTLVFNQDRLEVQSLTAVTGGGVLKVGGFLTYRNGLFADLTATANATRVRIYGISTTSNTSLHLTGNGQSMQLSGDILLTRFGLSPEFDFASLAGGGGGIAAPPDPGSFANKLHLNIHVTSSPQLDFQNSYAKLAGRVDLRVVGTAAVPSVLGRISITDGSATFAGVQYQLQRGEVYFNNPVRIDPVIDLDALARVNNYDVTIGLHGTSASLKPTYRSEPPLSEADIFALLALGRTQEQAQINQERQLQRGTDPTTSALLGGALNATVSNRVSKLFGGGSVKIDPSYVGTVGNSSARITVEQQLSRQLTVRFATNVNSSAQQLIQLQYQIDRNRSFVATRDENGVFSIVYKIRQRYK